MPQTDALDRREFLKLGSAAVAATSAVLGSSVAAQPAGFLAAPPIPLVRIGMVGIGLQGGSHLENFLNINGCHDAAALSAVVELSMRSTKNRARAMDVPDFTRGRWATNPPLGIVAV